MNLQLVITVISEKLYHKINKGLFDKKKSSSVELQPLGNCYYIELLLSNNFLVTANIF